ncbi:MAG: type I restriction endonuclease subunit R [Proteobacteria bacterium]|nr:type I restriction endonuclease subunit R [Pseudomonadota bacterium]
MIYNEDTLVQQTTADYLKDNLEWDESINAMQEVLGKDGTLGRDSESQVVLVRYLETKLKDLNPGLPETAYHDAIRTIVETSASQSLLLTNREKDKLYKDGVEVSFRNEKNELDKKRLRVFDYYTPENNHFLVVRELWVKGDVYRRRADLVCFVNGIPLVFMEVKNLNKDVRTAYEKNFSDYKDSIPHLFHHNAFVVLGNGEEAKIGSISSKYDHFQEWKRLAEYEPGVVDMETLLKGVCSKYNLMDLFENFIVFDDSGSHPVKIVARNHQYLGVNAAVKAIEDRSAREGKLGVFWHTQGSGKSYSIVFFTKKAHRKLGGNFTFLVLTDRDDLDRQIYNTFAGCGLADNDADPCRASSGADLKKKLGTQKAHIFSLIQKFNQEIKTETEAYSLRDDIIVITDEAHRTQYGTLALNMRNALPNASFIGFTGTPLFKEDEITRKVFGDYISTYDFQRAVEDGATVPLYYDARGEKLGIATHELNEKIATKLEELEIDDINTHQRLERALKQDYHVITAGKRLDQIARDFVDHYSEAWESGKAMMVCIDKITCGRVHKLVEFYWQQKILELENSTSSISDDQEQVFHLRKINWMKETRIAIVISEEQGEIEKFRVWDLDIVPHRKLIKEGFSKGKDKKLDIESAFKADDHPFRVAIVCAMWLTGFDVPSLSTLYLDKPLKAHTLMQAIARANRVSEGKNNGLVVDYCGILKNLRKALATFGGRPDGGREKPEDVEKEPTKPNEELLNSLIEAINLVQEFFTSKQFDLTKIKEASGFALNAAIIEAKEIVNQNDRTRKQFEIMAREVFKKFRACINIRPQINELREDRNVIDIIYKALQKDREKADISHIIRELHEIIDQAIDLKIDEKGPATAGDKPTGYESESKKYDISKIDFDRLRKEFERRQGKRTTVQNLRQAVENKLEKMLLLNPLRTDFQKHYEKLVREYNEEKDRITIEKTFEALLKFVQKMDEEESRAVREELKNDEYLAVFDILKKEELTKKDIVRIKKVSFELLETLKAEKLKIENWREKENTRDAVRQTIYDFLYSEESGLPVDSYEENEITQLTEELFKHIFRAYPTLPSPVYGDVA